MKRIPRIGDIWSTLQNISQWITEFSTNINNDVVGPGNIVYSNNAFIANQASRDNYEQSNDFTQQIAERSRRNMINTILVGGAIVFILLDSLD